MRYISWDSCNDTPRENQGHRKTDGFSSPISSKTKSLPWLPLVRSSPFGTLNTPRRSAARLPPRYSEQIPPILLITPQYNPQKVRFATYPSYYIIRVLSKQTKNHQSNHRTIYSKQSKGSKLQIPTV